MEWFLGIVHVIDTYALSLKEAIDSLFSKFLLSLYKIYGQDCDGASSMQGEVTSLKILIKRE